MGQLKPLSQIMPQQPVQQPVQQQPQYQQPAQPQQYQQQAPPQSNTQSFPLQSTEQLEQMRNNGRVELVVQDATSGYQVISTDQLNIATIEPQNPALAQELRMFDTNRDGWLVEAELKATVSSSPAVVSGEKVSTFEHVASSTLGGTMFGGAVGGLASKMGLNLGSKFGVKGWVAGAVGGAVVGLVGGFLTNKGGDAATKQDYTNAYGYRPETQWNNNRLVKTVL